MISATNPNDQIPLLKAHGAKAAMRTQETPLDDYAIIPHWQRLL